MIDLNGREIELQERDGKLYERPMTFHSHFSETPTMANIGEIVFEDGTKLLVPQPDKQAWKLADSYVNTLTELPTQTAVMEWVAEHPRSHAKPSRDPFWAVLCAVIGGLVLVGTGLAFLTLGIVIALGLFR